ncbi:hypothetical protein D9619_008645 [Psilocybe cf. subviscida]|uniref:Uncharacterized protein n=1 Tax=Psilocybe cf. subviscida TaxID=2480587 RepID=A0A8H5BC09_9AGAR|nr:hypothetical protein D9619_008645 [Psilocybe cf. subviscida]
MPIPESFRSEHPSNGTDIIINNRSRRGRLAAVFGPASIRKQLTIPHSKHNIQVYRGENGIHTPTGASPTVSLAQRPTVGRISPHIIGWMTLADSVVGQHPHARPLHARIATQAEIDMISGHVHIPWAHKNDPRRPQPTAVKVQRPIVLHPAVPPPVMMTPLKDTGNIHHKGSSANTNEITVEKRSPKGKSGRRLRGKENTPPMASSGSSRNRR